MQQHRIYPQLPSCCFNQHRVESGRVNSCFQYQAPVHLELCLLTPHPQRGPGSNFASRHLSQTVRTRAAIYIMAWLCIDLANLHIHHCIGMIKYKLCCKSLNLIRKWHELMPCHDSLCQVLGYSPGRPISTRITLFENDPASTHSATAHRLISLPPGEHACIMSVPGRYYVQNMCLPELHFAIGVQRLRRRHQQRCNEQLVGQQASFSDRPRQEGGRF